MQDLTTQELLATFVNPYPLAGEILASASLLSGGIPVILAALQAVLMVIMIVAVQIAITALVLWFITIVIRNAMNSEVPTGQIFSRSSGALRTVLPVAPVVFTAMALAPWFLHRAAERVLPHT